MSWSFNLHTVMWVLYSRPTVYIVQELIDKSSMCYRPYNCMTKQANYWKNEIKHYLAHTCCQNNWSSHHFKGSCTLDIIGSAKWISLKSWGENSTWKCWLISIYLCTKDIKKEIWLWRNWEPSIFLNTTGPNKPWIIWLILTPDITILQTCSYLFLR